MDKYHKIYDEFPFVEDIFFNLIYIPMINKFKEVSGYAISNLSLKDKLLEFSYHQTIFLAKAEKKYAFSNLGVSMHEIVIGGKAEKGHKIDHINSDGLLNTEENLRYVTDGLNAQNKSKQLNTSSDYIGVSWHKNHNKWRTTIRCNGENLNLGSFDDEIEAGKVYDMYAIDHYKGQCPQTNNLLNKNEIEDIKNNGVPEKYRKKIKERDLPKNICLTKSNTYALSIKVDNKRCRKVVKTLEEAILLKNQFLQEIEKGKEVAKYDKEITRNIDGYAIIYMNNGLTCIVDDDHWYDINQYKWYCYMNENDKIYSYPSGYVKGKNVQLHRYVYEEYVGPIPSHMTVDHIIPNNIFDVRLKNLRLADRSLQAHNKIKSKNSVDQYKGVKFNGYKYEVKVKEKYYGAYETAEEAAQKANEIYTMIYGKDATLNVIDHSKQTTKYNRIPEENITKEYIMSLTKVIDVQNIVIIKDLNTKVGETKLNKTKIKLSDIKLATLDKYKQVIVDKLYPLID